LQDELSQIRTAFDAFLVEYPLCYGYWKKYAEAERRHGNIEAATAVYQRGVAATPYSTDLWLAYAAMLQATDGDTEAVRRWGTQHSESVASHTTSCATSDIDHKCVCFRKFVASEHHMGGVNVDIVTGLLN
jgi:hypothetical protein